VPGAELLRVAIERKAFGARAVLSGVRFSAGAGEVLALLAPSGTGKTTALRIVLGLDKDFSGAVQRPPGRIGAVFQEPRLLPWMDVAANLRLVAPALTDGAVAALLETVGLPDAAARMPGQLSLGMARRVALARALAVRPALLVLDEPFASLDPMGSGLVSRAALAQGRSLQATVLIATHDLDQALATADRILVLTGAPASLAADLTAGSVSAQELRQRFGFLQGSLVPQTGDSAGLPTAVLP
jgi:ABC-type nitrate/sulfonate/bicarbonate transport system ATPase subunit